MQLRSRLVRSLHQAGERANGRLGITIFSWGEICSLQFIVSRSVWYTNWDLHLSDRDQVPEANA